MKTKMEEAIKVVSELNESEAEAVCDSGREDFAKQMLEVFQLAVELLRNDKWLPDYDDFEAVKHLHQHLSYYNEPLTQSTGETI